MSRTLDITVSPRRYGSVPRTPSRRTMDAATAARVLPQAIKDEMGKRLPPIMDALARLDRAIDRRNDRIIDARAKAVVGRVLADRAMARGGITSATSGYVRDSAGNRIRPMTPADLNAMADKHYGRVR